MSDKLVTGKGMTVLGLVLAAALIVWAVVDPGPAPPDRQRLSDLPTASSSLALRSAVGAVLGVQREAMLRMPQLDEEAIQALLDEYVNELGLELDPQEVQSLLARYRSIAARAESLLASAPSARSLSVESLLRSLIPSGATAGELAQMRQLAGLLGSLDKAGAGGSETSGPPADSLPGDSLPPPAAPAPQTGPGTGGPDWGAGFEGEFWQGGSQSEPFDDWNGGSETLDSGMDRMERDLSNMGQ